MIGYLNGIILDINSDENRLLVLTQGVGYRVRVNTELISKSKINQEINLFIHTAMREDGISLYGFEQKEEYAFFRQLIGISGVGPKMAMDILSAPVHVTQNAIVSGDADLLTKIKGVGKKTAERIVLELKGKVTPVKLEKSGGVLKGYGYNEDAVLALQGLGYEKMHIVRVLTSIPKEAESTEEIVKYFLKQAT